jgi:hypothetical protein
MHSTVANATQTPSHTARNQSARSAFSNTALRKANRELADVLGGKSMILVCISNPSKNCFHRQYTVLRGKVAEEEELGVERIGVSAYRRVGVWACGRVGGRNAPGYPWNPTEPIGPIEIL